MDIVEETVEDTEVENEEVEKSLEDAPVKGTLVKTSGRREMKVVQSPKVATLIEKRASGEKESDLDEIMEKISKQLPKDAKVYVIRGGKKQKLGEAGVENNAQTSQQTGTLVSTGSTVAKKVDKGDGKTNMEPLRRNTRSTAAAPVPVTSSDLEVEDEAEVETSKDGSSLDISAMEEEPTTVAENMEIIDDSGQTLVVYDNSNIGGMTATTAKFVAVPTEGRSDGMTFTLYENVGSPRNSSRRPGKLSGSGKRKAPSTILKAVCQYCGMTMLKKNLITHIRRAHTPREQLVCLDSHQGIYRLQTYAPGTRKKREKTIDYSSLAAPSEVGIEQYPYEGVEGKFLTEGEDILTTDLNDLSNRIRFGVNSLGTETLLKLVETMNRIEVSNSDEIAESAKYIKRLIFAYLKGGDDTRMRLHNLNRTILAKKEKAKALREDLKVLLRKKNTLEFSIQNYIKEIEQLQNSYAEILDTAALQFSIDSQPNVD